MKKKTKIMSIVLLSLLVVGVVSAVLVPYLSNRVKADIELTSPMVTGISLGDTDWGGTSYPDSDHTLSEWTTTGTLQIPIMKGGETVTLYIMSANEADVLITGFEEAIVTNPLGVNCSDFDSVVVRVDSIYGSLGYGTPQDVIALSACFVIDANSVKIGSPADSTWDIGETDVSEIVVTFNKYALGTYTFSYRII